MRRFAQIDVFGDGDGDGNPLAVVIDGDGLSTSQMQRFAHWMNLSETAFLLTPSEPGADYRVRIFTTSRELPFAGHPTLGSAHAWLQAHDDAGRTSIVQECGAGLIELRRIDGRLAFAAPPLLRSGPARRRDARRADGDARHCRGRRRRARLDRQRPGLGERAAQRRRTGPCPHPPCPR